MADVLRIQNTHGTLDWLASGGHVTMKPQNFHQKKKTMIEKYWLSVDFLIPGRLL